MQYFRHILLLAALAYGLPATPVAAAEAEGVTVVTSEYRFMPAHLHFKRGVLYRLHVENQGKELHEFTAPEFFRAVEMKDRSGLNREGTEVVLQPHEAKDVAFVPRQAGSFPLSCADHDFDGMVGDITVE